MLVTEYLEGGDLFNAISRSCRDYKHSPVSWYNRCVRLVRGEGEAFVCIFWGDIQPLEKQGQQLIISIA